jgi:Rad3-related DNA helicase
VCLGQIKIDGMTVRLLRPPRAGKDGLVAGKTGTGKTLAFLVPAVELLRRAGVDPAQRTISVLIISPTRELGPHPLSCARVCRVVSCVSCVVSCRVVSVCGYWY